LKHAIKIRGSYYSSLCFYGLQKIGFMNNPVDPVYSQWADKLNQLGEAFRFKAPLAGGPLFTLVYQIPGYLNPQSPKDLDMIFQATIDFIDKRDVGVFLDRFPVRTNYWNQWYTTAWLNHLFTGLEHDIFGAQQTLNVFSDFMQHIWDDYSSIYTNSLTAYNFCEREQKANRLDAFKQWHEQLNQQYPYSDFTAVICPQSGTFASSLGPEKIVFGAKHPWSVMENALFHEIGVRTANLDLLSKHPATAEIMKNDYYDMLKIIETEICHRKPNLLPDLEQDPFVRGMGLDRLMAWRSGQQALTDLPESLARLYARAKEEDLL